MIHEFNFNCIQGIRDGIFLYTDGVNIEKIDIKKSAEIWWDKHHKSTLMDIVLKKRAKNKYAGDKCFNFAKPYIRLYAGEDEMIFRKEYSDDVDASEAREFRMWWDDINIGLNQLGYWLFDEG